MFAWLLVVTGILGAEVAPPPVRPIPLRGPILLWESGSTLVWSSASDGRQTASNPALGAPLFGVDDARTWSLVLPERTYVVFGTLDGDLHRINGPQTVTLAMPDAEGDPVRLSLSEQNSGTWVVVNLGGRFATGRRDRPGVVRSPSSEPGERHKAALTLTAPRARVLRGDPREPLMVTWAAGADDTRRFDLEIAEIGGDGHTLATLERWWRIRGPAFRTWRPLPPGRRFRVTLEDSVPNTGGAKERTEIAVETISDDERALVDEALGALQDATNVIGPEAAAVFQAIVLSSFGLDGEAAGRWGHLFAMHPTHPRAPEIAAQALAALP